MNPIKNVSMALAVLALGALAPGCAPHPDETLGSLCAAAANGEPHCVRSNQGPAAAWSQAAPHGELPVQMWAKRPDAVALEDLVASPPLLKAWFADTDKVHTYVRDTKKNAESYLASMGGNGGRLLDEAINRQQQLLSRSPVDAIGDFKAALNDKASAEKSPVVAALATDKQSMAAVQVVFEKARTDMASLESAYAGIAAQFTTYRATEAAETQTYKAPSPGVKTPGSSYKVRRSGGLSSALHPANRNKNASPEGTSYVEPGVLTPGGGADREQRGALAMHAI
jgi:hypothetical protein